MNIIIFGLIFVVFYFFLIRPQAKKAREQQSFLEGLKKGDKVITSGGIIGKIAKVSDFTVLLEVDGTTKIKLQKAAITGELGNEAADSN
ncbi:UNVERIFIED_CONTAM: hypothetical protein GTU68_054274 [Idotea baltica]|nr:hypothetical protein [Idotea baltica]